MTKNPAAVGRNSPSAPTNETTANHNETTANVDWRSLLFTSSQLVCHKKNVDSYPQRFADKYTQFFIVNPLKSMQQIARLGAVENIAAYHNIVVEFDGLSIKQQQSKVKKAGLPFATATFSGNKSIHYIISCKDAFKTHAEYKYYAEAIYAVLDGAPDPKCKNVNRLTRTPQVVRADNGKMQDLLATGKRITVAELHYWLANHPEVRHKFVKFQQGRIKAEEELRARKAMQNVEGAERLRLPRIYRDMMEAGINHPDVTSRHDGLVRFSAWLKNNGYEVELEEYVLKAADAMGIGERDDAKNLIAYFLGAR